MQYVNLSLSIMNFINLLILFFVYFGKKRIKSFENSLYSGLILVTLFNVIVEIISYFSLTYGLDPNSMLYMGTMKIILILYVSWIMLFLSYNTIISYKIKNMKSKKSIFLKMHLVLFILISIIVIFAPLKIETIENLHIPSGMGCLIVYSLAGIASIADIFLALRNGIKNIDKKFLPVLFTFIFATIIAFVQMVNPQIFLITPLLTYVTFTMYFTIENPDVKMMQQLELARDHAEKANRAKSDFLSSMSHEIRTPLNAIVGFSEMIETEESIEACKEDAKDIVLASHTLLEIVNGILDISKIEANKMEIVNKEYSLLPELDNLAKLMVPRIGDKDLKLISNFAPDIPAVLYGDIGKIKEVITNLLTNAVKYTDSGTINFNVSCINEKEYSSFVISVEDTGRGIKADHIDKLFTKFQRLEEDKNTTIEGTGLGLAITKNLVEMMGGKIVVQSEYGKGSIFTVYLKQKIVKLHAGSAGEAVSSEEKLDFSGKKVLVVDDNGLNIKLAKRLLANYNIDIDTAESGFECIDKVKENKYDLILLDDMMPKMRGTETLAKLKEDSSFKVPVVALTANSLSGMREVYLNAGFVGYLAKPIEKVELNKVLSKYLGNEKDYSDKKILIVDDNKINIKIASKILSTFKFQIDEALSGAECLEKASNTKYDIIFMDYMMPGMNGVETFNKLKTQEGFDTPVVVLTADVVDNAKEKFMKDGFVDYISKPIDQKYLKEVIDKLIK